MKAHEQEILINYKTQNFMLPNISTVKLTTFQTRALSQAGHKQCEHEQ